MHNIITIYTTLSKIIVLIIIFIYLGPLCGQSNSQMHSERGTFEPEASCSFFVLMEGCRQQIQSHALSPLISSTPLNPA